MMDLKRVAKLQTELIESRNQIKQIESALKEVKVHLDVQQRSEQENLEKVLREMEAKDKEIQACKLQLEELKNEVCFFMSNNVVNSVKHTYIFINPISSTVFEIERIVKGTTSNSRSAYFKCTPVIEHFYSVVGQIELQ